MSGTFYGWNPDYAAQLAKLMRESADLVEKGLIRDISVDIDFGIETMYGAATMYGAVRYTGERTVKIIMRVYGDILDESMQSATTATRVIGVDQKLLKDKDTNE